MIGLAIRSWLRLPSEPLARVAALTLMALVGLGTIGSIAQVGGDPTALLAPRLLPPGGEFWLGTDTLGRSLFPRVIEGIRVTFVIAAVAVLIVSVLGTLIGMVAAYLGSVVDAAIVRIADVLFSFPGMLMALMVAAMIGPGATGAVITIVLVTIPLVIRVARAATLRVRNRDFVVAVRVGGASAPRIIGVHLLPSVAGPMIVQTTYLLSAGMLIEGGMSFVGLGVQPPDASLGSLLQEGRDYLTFAPWLVFAPGLTLALAMLSINVVGDYLRDAFEPRQSRSLT